MRVEIIFGILLIIIASAATTITHVYAQGTQQLLPPLLENTTPFPSLQPLQSLTPQQQQELRTKILERAQVPITITDVNLAKLIIANSSGFTGGFGPSKIPVIDILYLTPKVAAIEGYALMQPKMSLDEFRQISPDLPKLDNPFIWRAIEIMKEHGYDVESIVTSGLSSRDNPLMYHIVFAHK